MMIASILICNPEIIILDEPTVGLDNTSKKNLINYLTKLKKLQNKTIVIASNDIDFINKISDDVIALENGKVIKSEKKSEIFRDVNFFDKHHISVPQIIKFEDIVLKEKGILLGYRDDVNDLVKDILRKC
jgi:energy-coupling factor transport system ATP-binding protein